MVHVKKVEIFGFKSFGFKNTTVHFMPGLVSISGPNGSGKSNILDAIIFAMGENKPKVMRVDKLRSLIHDIEGGRRGPKMARSSVHFDNTDRKIPVDSDTVEITREMDDKGENIYYFNKKKTTRHHILDLLATANAGLDQLNAVQQGTVTRISEMTPDEKRISIETILGLSYFDDKKTEALKHLDDAGKKLDIALAKMGEVRKRLDELEEERNQKLRYDFLEKELAKYKAIAAAGKLKTTLALRSSKEQLLSEYSDNAKNLDKEKSTLETKIKDLESVKSSLMNKADDYNRAKASIDQELSDARQEYEAEKNSITMAKKGIEQIETRLPEIQTELEESGTKQNTITNQINQTQTSLDLITSRKDKIDQDIKQVDSRRARVLNEQSQAAAQKSQVDQKIKVLTEQLNSAKLQHATLQNKKTDIDEKIQTNTGKLDELKKNIAALVVLKQNLHTVMKNNEDTISELKTRLDKLNSKKSKITDELEDLGQLLEKSSKAADQYESKLNTVKGFMHEDYTAAKLKEDADRLGIMGLVYEMIQWDKRYERSVLAVGSDWLKTIVVKDLATMIGITEFARSKKLPKLKMIPFEAIPKSEMALPKLPGVLGVLSDYVQCDYRHIALKKFLFGSVVLAASKESAYDISKKGYKSVTLDGEFFEARGGTVVIDINSKLSKLTKLISMSTDIEGLISSIKLIKKYILKQKNNLKKLEGKITGNSQRLSVSEKNLASTSETYSNLESRLASYQETQKQLDARISKLLATSSDITTEISKHESQIASVQERIRIVEENYARGKQDEIAYELARVNREKSAIEMRYTKVTDEHRRTYSDLTALQSNHSRVASNIKDLRTEELSLSNHKVDLEADIQRHEQTLTLKNTNLVKLREKEQELISSSSSSIGNLQIYDEKLKTISDRDRHITREINSLQRKSDSLKRDLADIAQTEANLRQSISAFRSDKIETFDVTSMLQALSAELQSMDSLNAKAPESYLITADGYSSWSPRKNALEEERNSIVRFIEKIDSDKRQRFLDGFDKVDKEIRLIFSKMTGGNAWMELQNEDNIFDSGISYMIQFPNKPKRESTSISGGEKTLAAIVFVLALQKLNPSPFYLFDEIDAHLDAPNSERLAKILEERSEESQFIMVSLKDSVVQKAKLIYGVYPKNGISNVVTYKDKKVYQSRST